MSKKENNLKKAYTIVSIFMYALLQFEVPADHNVYKPC